ncbi:hypothetical protein [Cysteiniphilum sp. JM-1]|uniref:hypothetical protein n=1 Tax=Cysteiniphilum sp. JM-1 TaxID=2610891 RepID=UPI0012469DF3|nr:hypothetical protein [Cysteiniphilum sp. JM-1]
MESNKESTKVKHLVMVSNTPGVKVIKNEKENEKVIDFDLSLKQMEGYLKAKLTGLEEPLGNELNKLTFFYEFNGGDPGVGQALKDLSGKILEDVLHQKKINKLSNNISIYFICTDKEQCQAILSLHKTKTPRINYDVLRNNVLDDIGFQKYIESHINQGEDVRVQFQDCDNGTSRIFDIKDYKPELKRLTKKEITIFDYFNNDLMTSFGVLPSELLDEDGCFRVEIPEIELMMGKKDVVSTCEKYLLNVINVNRVRGQNGMIDYPQEPNLLVQGKLLVGVNRARFISKPDGKKEGMGLLSDIFHKQICQTAKFKLEPGDGKKVPSIEVYEVDKDKLARVIAGKTADDDNFCIHRTCSSSYITSFGNWIKKDLENSNLKPFTQVDNSIIETRSKEVLSLNNGKINTKWLDSNYPDYSAFCDVDNGRLNIKVKDATDKETEYYKSYKDSNINALKVWLFYKATTKNKDAQNKKSQLLFVKQDSAPGTNQEKSNN